MRMCKSKRRSWIMWVIAGSLAGACDDWRGPPSVEVDASDAETSDTTLPATWQNGIGAIFAARCTQCHRDWATSYAGVVKKIEAGKLEPRVASGHQIPGGDQAKILGWIEDGYPE